VGGVSTSSGSAHRHYHDAALAREHARDMAGDGRLPDPLAQADHRERGRRHRLERRRFEAKVGPGVRQPERKGTRGPQHPFPRPEHRFVGEIDHEIGFRRGERVDQRHAVVVSAAQLLGPADEQRTDDFVGKPGERVPHDRRVVLAVDQHDRTLAHCDRTSSSIRAVYFSYVFVSVENWMMRSCPWNG
jgi:hypothetical protein